MRRSKEYQLGNGIVRWIANRPREIFGRPEFGPYHKGARFEVSAMYESRFHTFAKIAAFPLPRDGSTFQFVFYLADEHIDWELVR